MAVQASRRQAGLLETGPQSRAAPAQVVRFDRHQRLQHLLMMSSFIVLALTGLPQKFSDLSVSRWWVESLGGLETVRDIHRAAAFIMLADCVYHVGYLLYRIGVQRRLGCFGMVPTFRDLRDGLQTVLYFLGLAPEKPKFGRFSYLEKFDYWAVFWGIAIIGGSGLILMYPVPVTGLLPGQAVRVALTLHSDEAILAVGWILVMHTFNVHLAPWVFPFNPAIFTGKVSARRYAEDHPLEWARLEAAGAAAQAPRPRPERADRRRARASERVARRPAARNGAKKGGAIASTAWAAWARKLVILVRKKLV
jgi:cytochrome b subunit of formate dehydrogenase